MTLNIDELDALEFEDTTMDAEDDSEFFFEQELEEYVLLEEESHMDMWHDFSDVNDDDMPY